MLMATATDLVVIFLALEVLSLAVYVLTGIRRDSPASTEAALNILPPRRLLQRVSSSTASRSPTTLAGSTRLDRIGSADGGAGAGADADAAARAGISAGRLRVQSVRRCRFTCGRPTPTRARRPSVTGFMSTGVKAAAFAAFVRVFLVGVRSAAHELVDRCLWSIAAATMIVGTGGRCGADQRQADARVFEHRARRLPARSR